MPSMLAPGAAATTVESRTVVPLGGIYRGDMIAIPLALAASLLYGLSDFLGGVKSRSLPQLSVLLISQATTLVVLVVAVVVLAPAPPSGSHLVYAVTGGLLEAVGVAAMYRGLAVGSMSVVAPVAATAPVVPVVAGLALGELPTPVRGRWDPARRRGRDDDLARRARPARGARRRPERRLRAPHRARVRRLLRGHGHRRRGRRDLGAARRPAHDRRRLRERVPRHPPGSRGQARRRPRADADRRADPRRRRDVRTRLDPGPAQRGRRAQLAADPVVTITLAHRYLNERIERQQLRGIAVAFAGAAALCIASEHDGPALSAPVYDTPATFRPVASSSVIVPPGLPSWTPLAARRPRAWRRARAARPARGSVRFSAVGDPPAGRGRPGPATR